VALRAHAEGVYCAVAAVELLIGHGFWLCRADFVERFVEFVGGARGQLAVALIDWQGAVDALDAAGLACSSGQERVLRVAASLAEGIPVDLGAAVSGLDALSIELVAAAVLAGNGRRQTGVADLPIPAGDGVCVGGGTGGACGRVVR